MIVFLLPPSYVEFLSFSILGKYFSVMHLRTFVEEYSLLMEYLIYLFEFDKYPYLQYFLKHYFLNPVHKLLVLRAYRILWEQIAKRT